MGFWGLCCLGFILIVVVALILDFILSWYAIKKWGWQVKFIASKLEEHRKWQEEREKDKNGND